MIYLLFDTRMYRLLFLVIPVLAQAHPSGLDKQGGHTNRKTETYHCHKSRCRSESATLESEISKDSSSNTAKYRRKD